MVEKHGTDNMTRKTMKPGDIFQFDKEEIEEWLPAIDHKNALILIKELRKQLDDRDAFIDTYMNQPNHTLVWNQFKAIQSEAERLWCLLDDISTAGDMFKPKINGYFKYVNERCDKRDGMITSDGYNLIWEEWELGDG